jgi:hypothetical protein
VGLAALISDRERGQLPETSKVWDGRASFTFTRLFDACPHSALLYETYRGHSSIEMERGSAMHAIQERARLHAVEHGEKEIPPELVKDIANDVLATHHVPLSEHDNLREMAYRWASEWSCDPDRLAAVERLFEIDLPGGFIVRARVDCALLSADGDHLTVIDTKTSRAMPSYEEIARKRPDQDAYMAKNIQLVIYALALTRGYPIIELANGDEVRGPGPIAPRPQRIDVRFEYPAIAQKSGDYAGMMARREMTLSPIELEQAMDSLAAMGRRLVHTIASEHWPARTGTHCNQCPARLLCPISPPLRVFQDVDGMAIVGELETLMDASLRADWVYHAKELVRGAEKELKNWSKGHDGQAIPFGRDLEFAWASQSATSFDRDRLAEDLSAGKAIEPGEYEKTRTGTRWVKRVRGGSDNGQDSGEGA